MITLDRLGEEFQSEYLRNGFAQEQVELYDFEVDLGLRTARANLKVINPYIPEYQNLEVIPHLSDLTAYRALGQLIVGFNCVQLNKPKRNLGELWQISYSTNNKKPIPLGTKINFLARCKKWIPRGSLIYQDWEFDIANRSFYGEARCAISSIPVS